jgi:hypothetical protein
MDHSVSAMGRPRAPAKLGTTLPAINKTNPMDSSRERAWALGARKRERARPRATTNAQPMRSSTGEGSRTHPTDPLNPVTSASITASAVRVTALGRFLHG